MQTEPATRKPVGFQCYIAPLRMACTIHKVKHLYWYMVLATVVVLIWILNSPKTMGKMIVAGSSASQHEPRDARVKRFLRPSAYMTEEINGGDEERVDVSTQSESMIGAVKKADFDLNVPAESESTIGAVKKADFDLNVPAESESTIGALEKADFDLSAPAESVGMTEAVKIGEELEVGMPKADENAKSLFERAGLLDWANSLGDLSLEKYLIAGSAKLSELIKKNGKERVLSMLAAAKKVPATKDVAESLEVSLILKWIVENHDEGILEMLIAGKADVAELLASLQLNIWMYLYKKVKHASPIPTLFNELSKRLNEPTLAKQLFLAQGNGDTKETAEILAMYQVTGWGYHEKIGDLVFQRLLLKAGINMFDSQMWDTWISYMMMFEDSTKQISVPELALSVLRKHYSDDVLFKWIAAAQTDEGKQRASYLKSALENALKKAAEKEGKAPAATKRQRSGGEASATTKRQRNDDGQ